MNITIKREQYDRGMIFFRYEVFAVKVVVEFTKEELSAIKTAKIGGEAVYEVPWGAPVDGKQYYRNCKINNLIAQDKFCTREFQNLREANKFDDDLRNSILPGLKNFLHKSNPRKPSDSFTL